MSDPKQERPVYPLGQNAQDTITSSTGKRVSELTLEAIRQGRVEANDFTIHPDTLRAQAQIAEEAGFPQLAANFRRAAELTSVPQEKVLAIYEALRPYRLKYEQLMALADEIEQEYGAVENASFIRQAAEAYKERGLA